MLAWLLANIILPIITYELPIIEKDIMTMWINWRAASKQKQVDAENVQTQTEAVKTGDLDAIAKAGEDTLNGTKS